MHTFILKFLDFVVGDLERGVEYEFRVAGRNAIGVGQEAVKYYSTPEGAPDGPPTEVHNYFHVILYY